MQTSYKLDTAAVYGRPSVTKYPAGFFVEDYRYTGNGDLDEFNGRYCRTPEFPNGVYAYFAGISTDTQSLAREPQFPYFVGPQFRDTPIRGAGDSISQDFNINDKPIYRNTFPYVVGNTVAGSEFIDQSYLFDVQETSVDSISSGTIKGIDIIGVGASFRVGDIPRFDDEQDILSTVVDRVTGQEVNQIEELIKTYRKEETKIIQLDKETIRVYVYPAHAYLENNDVIISGVSTFTAALRGDHKITTDTEYMTLYAPVPETPTATVTDVFVNTITDNVSVGSSVRIGTGSSAEPGTVLNIFPLNKALRVRRNAGYGFTNPVGSDVRVIPNYFDIQFKGNNFESEIDQQYYFNPKQTVGVGIETGGAYEVTYSIGNINQKVSVPTQAIYAPNHRFRTNEAVDFGKFQGDGALVVTDGDNVYTLPAGFANTTTAYVVNLSQNFIGLRTDPRGKNLFFSSNGDDSFLYNIKTQRFAETVTVDRIDGKITTQTPHNLQDGDVVRVSVASSGPSGVGSNTSVQVKFDEITQSLIVDPKYANPIGVTTSSGLIEITAHNFNYGDIVLYENYGTAIGGLDTHRKYYVIPFDRDRFQVAETSFDIRIGNENPVKLTSVGVSSYSPRSTQDYVSPEEMMPSLTLATPHYLVETSSSTTIRI